jgi:RNA polymerase sigma factor (TIGR02999 family)
VYAELRRIAERLMGGQRADHTLQPTALVHEAYLKLIDREGGGRWKDRRHFVRLAASAMRSVLVDHARGRAAVKRSGGEREPLPLDQLAGLLESGGVDLLSLDEALSRLEAQDAELARIVELRFFVGLTIDETAAALERSPATVERRWRVARMWLRSELDAGAP